MWREIEWNEASEEHIAPHKITPDEVEQVVNTRPRWVQRGREDTELIYGTTDAGKYVLVVLVESLTGLYFVVTAREMEPAEQRAFRRRAR